MKKKDVVRALANFLEGTSPIYPEVYAKDIIEFLEDQGMLPPYFMPDGGTIVDIKTYLAEKVCWGDENEEK